MAGEGFDDDDDDDEVRVSSGVIVDIFTFRSKF